MTNKKFAAFLAVVLALAMMVGIVPSMAEGGLQEAGGTLGIIPPTSSDVDVQKPFHDALKNAEGKLEDYYKVIYSGYYDISMDYKLGEEDVADRDLRMYIPENSRYSQPTIFLAVPSDTDPYQFMVDSGWKDAADNNSLTIYLLMPQRVKDENGNATAWGKWSDEKDVMKYISAAVDVCGQRPGIQTVSYCFYGVGYGDAADCMAQYVMQNPTKLAGAFAIGATGLDKETAEAMQAKDSAEAGVKVSEIAVPFGIVAAEENEGITALVDYFRAANKSEDSAKEENGFQVYAPKADSCTRPEDSDACACVYYKKADVSQCMNAEFARNMFSIFNTVRRYPGYRNTELRTYNDVHTSPDYRYYTSLTALGRYTYGGDINGTEPGEEYNREWWVYVPETAQARMDNGEKVEVLFLFMGSNGYGDEIAQRTGWDKVADKEGFIIVCPSGHVRHQGNFGNFSRNGVDVYQYCTNWNWNPTASAVIPDDLLMIDDIYTWLFNTEGADFYGKVDPSKVYASGQSAGGAFAHHVAEYRPQYFAASVPCSWVDTGVGADTSSDVAMVVIMGQNDTTIPGALSTSTDRDGSEGGAKVMFDNYDERYGNLADKDGHDSWSDFTFMRENEGEKSVCTQSEGNFNEYIMQTKAGVPMFTGIEVVGMTHATIPSECVLAWNTISHFSKDAATGALYYDGVAVDTPVTTAILAK